MYNIKWDHATSERKTPTISFTCGIQPMYANKYTCGYSVIYRKDNKKAKY